MSWQLSSSVGHVPDDPVGASVAEAVAEMLRWSTVELHYSPEEMPPPPQPDEPATASATGPGPPGWQITLTVRLRSRIAPLLTPASAPLLEFLRVLPGAGLRAAARLSNARAAGAHGAADPAAMQTETRLHHLIDAGNLDAQTLARFAALDGATILDRDGKLLAYGAIVTSADSHHEGARTAAATTLSHTAEIVLKVSVDGDITVFRAGDAIATLLG